MLCRSGVGKLEDAPLDGKQHSSTEPAAPSSSAPKQPSISAPVNALDAPAACDSSEALPADSAGAVS